MVVLTVVTCGRKPPPPADHASLADGDSVVRTATTARQAQFDPWDDCWRNHQYDWTICRQVRESVAFQKYPGVALRRADELLLVLTTGDTLVVRDTTTD